MNQNEYRKFDFEKKPYASIIRTFIRIVGDKIF